MSANKTLILCRHGHRDTAQRSLNNGLTEKGRAQAKAIRWFVAKRFGPAELEGGVWLVSSPKLRCLETLQPAAKALERHLDSHPGLDETGVKESSASLARRVQGFLAEWQDSQAAVTIVCSHGDWLPIATQQLLGFSLEFKKGSWVEIESVGGRAQLKWLIPSFKPFL